ncbi:MAG: hypothetical protein WB771_03285 [Solirubrobacterales bacterium]
MVGALGGLGLLVATFLPWYSAGGENATAWQAFSIIDVILAAAAVMGLSVAVCVLARLSVSYPFAGSSAATGFGAVALILIVYRLIDPPGAGGVDLEIGAWLGLVCAAAITVGGYLGMQPMKGPRAASAA